MPLPCGDAGRDTEARHEESGNPVAHRRPKLFGRTGAHIAGGKHTGDGRLHGRTGQQDPPASRFTFLPRKELLGCGPMNTKTATAGYR